MTPEQYSEIVENTVMDLLEFRVKQTIDTPIMGEVVIHPARHDGYVVTKDGKQIYKGLAIVVYLLYLGRTLKEQQ